MTEQPEASEALKPPAPRPCQSCPYRRDVPSGLWHPDEYVKLALYDQSMSFQPQGVFMCHQADGRVCAGWAGCHDGEDLLAVRLAEVTRVIPPDIVKAIIEYVSPVPLFPSGTEAAKHGMAEVAAPGDEAKTLVRKLLRNNPSLETADPGDRSAP